MINSTEHGEIPFWRNKIHAGGNGHTAPSEAQPSDMASPPTSEDHRPHKKVVRYKECLKNHAAALGGNATDGCGEFMPSGDEGTIEAFKCSACNCHRNFHRKEIESDCSSLSLCYHTPLILNSAERSPALGHHHNAILGSPLGYPTNTVIMSYRSGSVASESDEKDDDYGSGAVARPAEKVRKRFRTKFTKEQKERMLSFAEKAGWRMKKLEESVVQQFCQETGIKRRVLKVWIHNNKHNFAKKNSTS